MDEIFKSLLVQMPFVVMVGLALYRVYVDGRADRAYMMSLLEKIYLRQKGEETGLGDDTLSKRPV